MANHVDEIKITRQCLVCGTGLSSALTGKMRQCCNDQPEDAVAFVSVKRDGEEWRTEICICNTCLEVNKRRTNRYVLCEVITALAR